MKDALLAVLKDPEAIRGLLTVNAPNGVTIAIINWDRVQAAATLTLTVVSILSTLVLLWLNVRKLKGKDK
jgi:hypothetical protein